MTTTTHVRTQHEYAVTDGPTMTTPGGVEFKVEMLTVYDRSARTWVWASGTRTDGQGKAGVAFDSRVGTQVYPLPGWITSALSSVIGDPREQTLAWARKVAAAQYGRSPE